MSLQALKKNRKSNLQALTAKLEDTQEKRSWDDDRFWKPERDKSGNGFAIIRFLPQIEEETVPYQRVFSHGFQGKGGWYIENSLTTLNRPDPVAEYNTGLWNNGTEAGKDQARKQKRKLSYISNIYVIKDQANPENEGKVFLYKYGKKIFDKITESMNPEFEGEVEVNPFCLWEGADFALKIRKVDGFVNYDKSEFGKPKALFDTDEELEDVYNQCRSLEEFIGEDQFKSYEELKEKMERVLGLVEDKATPFNTEEFEVETTNGNGSTPFQALKETVAPSIATEGDGDETMNYFKSLADE